MRHHNSRVSTGFNSQYPQGVYETADFYPPDQRYPSNAFDFANKRASKQQRGLQPYDIIISPDSSKYESTHQRDSEEEGDGEYITSEQAASTVNGILNQAVIFS